METMKEQFNRMIREAETICVLGHISPDGDCLGSTLGVRNYILNLCRTEGMKKKVMVCLEEASAKFSYLTGFSEILHEPEAAEGAALCIVCDCADEKRLGKFVRCLKTAAHSICLDHHVTNQGFAELCRILPEASSASEVVYDLMETELVDRATAECIYTGLVHDTGVFRYSCTSRHTMEIAGACMETGINFNEIIDDSFFAMNLNQKQTLGCVLSELSSFLSGRLVAGHITAETMEKYGVSNKDMDGIIDEIRTTRGAVCAVFMYQAQNRQYKVSLRSNSDALDVSLVAQSFGGGGHKRAAGCFMSANPQQNVEKIIAEVEKQLGTV